MMKTVSGEVVYTKPTSLSKVAKILINFDFFDNGAPYNVSAYLRRALASFNELVQFHKELKAKPSDRKHKKHRVSNFNDVNSIKISKNSRVAEEKRVEDAGDWWKHKKYRKLRKIEQNPDEVEAYEVIDVEDSGKHKKYENPVMFQKYPDEAEEEKVKNVDKRPINIEQYSYEFEDGRVGDVEDSIRKRGEKTKKRKKKKREDVEKECGGSFGADEGNSKDKRKRKRISEEVDDGEIVDFAKQSYLNEKEEEENWR